MADNTALSDLELEGTLQLPFLFSVLLIHNPGVTIHRPETENLSKEDTVSGERLSIWQKACFRWFQQRLLLLIQELHEVDTMRIQELFEQPRCHDPPECQGLLEISLLWVQCLKNHLASNSEEEVTLHTMLEALSKNGLVNDASTNNLIDMYHLIFIFIGWMTMLYNPNLRSRSGCFEICYTKLDSRIGIRARRRQKQVPATGVVEVSETLRLPHQSFVYLLAQLGLSLPQMNCSDHIQKPLGAARSDIFYADSILPSNIGFYSLNRVGNVKIKWSSSVCEHLDFDERSQTLVLFAYPAFCALMCSTDENAYLLDG
jgi:hypothetical protein